MKNPDKEQIDLKRLEIDIRNKLAQEHNWVEQERQWQQQAAQRKTQHGYWMATVSLAVIALFLNFFKG